MNCWKIYFWYSLWLQKHSLHIVCLQQQQFFLELPKMTAKFCLLNFMSQEPYIIWSWLMIHMCKRLCPGVSLYFFQILIFGINSGAKKQKWPKMRKNCLTSYLRNCTSYDCGFWYTRLKWWYLQQIFSFFQKSDFSGFSKFINKCQMEILRCAPPSSHVCDFFVTLWLILSELELSRTELPNYIPNILMENCDHTICPVLSILFCMTRPIRFCFLKHLSLS